MIKLREDKNIGHRLSKGLFEHKKSQEDDERFEEKVEPESSNEDGFNEDIFDSKKTQKEEDSIEEFAKEVLKGMANDGILPIPGNFSLYFERYLEEKPAEFKKQVKQILELEEGNEEEKRVNFEQRVKSGFSYTKQILQVVATLYKNLNLMNRIVEKRGSELEGLTNSAVAINIIRSLEKDIKKLNSIMSNQTEQLKEYYKKNAEILSEVESEAIFDSKYGVYNKRYFMSQLEKEQKSVEMFNHKSTLMMAKIPISVSKKIGSQRGVDLIARTISRLLLKTSRRSDVIAHFGDGVFGLLLKHSDISTAKRAAERLHDMVSSTNFFYGEKEFHLDIRMGIAKIDALKSVDESVECALESLKNADMGNELYEVCKYDVVGE